VQGQQVNNFVKAPMRVENNALVLF